MEVGGLAPSGVGQTVLGDLLVLSPPPCWSALCWHTQGTGHLPKVSGESTWLLHKAVNHQPALSAKLQPAPALLRLDPVYLKEPLELGLFMPMESSCFELAGEQRKGGELFDAAAPGVRCRVPGFAMCAVPVVGTRVVRMLCSVLTPHTHVPNEVLFSLLQAATSFIVTLCPLEAWSTRASSQPSSLPWTCMTRTKPERNPCSFLALFPFFSFLIPIVVYSFHGSPLSEEELLFSRTRTRLLDCKDEDQAAVVSAGGTFELTKSCGQARLADGNG